MVGHLEDMINDSDSESEVKDFSARLASVNLYRCPEIGCHKTFSRPSRLQTHILSHTGDRPFKCDLCDKSFTRNAHLKRHVQVNHEKAKPNIPSSEVSCQICNANFANKYSLKKHVKRVHEVKQYSCGECDKTFHKNHLLRSHMAEHSGSNPRLPFKCDQCEEAFQYPMYLKRHLRKHKGYSCDKCEDVFERWTDLQQHKNSSHPPAPKPALPPVRCDQCTRMFPTMAILQRHATIHTETRPVFHCPIECCPRYFYFKNNLSQHLRSYHGSDKYQCSQSGCAQKFSTKQKLLYHLEVIHRQEDSEKIIKKKPSRPRNGRKDLGKFKKPMVAVLSGLSPNKKRAARLLTDERIPLDKVEDIRREVNKFIGDTSETGSDSEVFVGCMRKPGEWVGRYAQEKLGTIKRIEPDKHFMRVRFEESESDTDLENSFASDHTTVQQKEDRRVDFSKYLLKSHN
jgi:RNase P subunit RPR2